VSLLAAFLSDNPYVWFAPHLGDEAGWLSIWGHEPLQREGPTHANAATAVEAVGSWLRDGDVGVRLPTELSAVLAVRRADSTMSAMTSYITGSSQTIHLRVIEDLGGTP